MQNTFTKGQQINAGSFQISIGSFDTGDVAIISKSSGSFVKLSDVKKNSIRLKRVKRELKSWISSDSTFNFQHMTPDLTQDLIDILKGNIKTRKLSK